MRSQLGKIHRTICGTGALGSHLADNLVRQGARKLAVIDCDRVEQHNIGIPFHIQLDQECLMQGR